MAEIFAPGYCCLWWSWERQFNGQVPTKMPSTSIDNFSWSKNLRSAEPLVDLDFNFTSAFPSSEAVPFRFKSVYYNSLTLHFHPLR